VRKSSFDVEHRLTNGSELATQGFETRVWTMRDPNDPERIKSCRIPPDILARLGIEVRSRAP
jgi:4-hydroxybenzoyl-CoA thioesterase